MAHSGLKWVPNTFTVLRVLLCPAIAYLVVQHAWFLAFALFIGAAATDFLDGYFARRFAANSTSGRILDPVCDKIYVLSLFSLLMVEGVCPPWFLGLLISVSLLLGSGYLFLKLPRRFNFDSFVPTTFAKWNSGLQQIWIGLLLLDLGVRGNTSHSTLESALQILVYLALAGMQTAVFFRYFQRFRIFVIPEIRALLTPR